MSWTGNILSKVGHFLSDRSFLKDGGQDKLEGFHNHAFVDDMREMDSANGGYRPDASAMTSFLLTILSSSDARYPKCRGSPEGPHDAPHGNNLITTAESWNHHGAGSKEQMEPLIEDSQQSTHEFLGDELALIHNQRTECLFNSASQPPFKLPPMSEDSVLLSEDFRLFIYLALPTLAKDRHWILLYSTARHGTSMRTLYQKSSMLSEPYLVVIRDLKGTTFGGLATAPLKPTAQRKYLGTSDTFVFTNLHKDLQLYKATGANRYYLLCTNDAISFGGGGRFAIHLDDTLLTGSSGACDTFGNSCLASSLDFSVVNVEVWGFSHALKQG